MVQICSLISTVLILNVPEEEGERLIQGSQVFNIMHENYCYTATSPEIVDYMSSLIILKRVGKELNEPRRDSSF